MGVAEWILLVIGIIVLFIGWCIMKSSHEMGDRVDNVLKEYHEKSNLRK